MTAQRQYVECFSAVVSSAMTGRRETGIGLQWWHSVRNADLRDPRRTQEERAAIIAAERANTERLLAAISESINRDLPLRIEEVVSRQLTGLAAAITPVLRSSIEKAMPQARTLRCHVRCMCAIHMFGSTPPPSPS